MKKLLLFTTGILLWRAPKLFLSIILFSITDFSWFSALWNQQSHRSKLLHSNSCLFRKDKYTHLQVESAMETKAMFLDYSFEQQVIEFALENCCIHYPCHVVCCLFCIWFLWAMNHFVFTVFWLSASTACDSFAQTEDIFRREYIWLLRENWNVLKIPSVKSKIAFCMLSQRQLWNIYILFSLSETYIGALLKYSYIDPEPALNQDRL